MMRFTHALAIVIPTCIAFSTPAFSASTFHCGAGDMTYTVVVNPATPEFVEVDVSVGEQMDQSLARKFDLPAKPTGSGFRYEHDAVEFRGKGQEATITVVGETFECELAAAQNHDSGAVGGNEGPLLNMAGQSYGGKLRDGPGTNFSQIGSLGEGNRVTIVRNTGVKFNGYDWFEINAGGRTGYHWGGIMCSARPVDGIYQVCGN